MRTGHRKALLAASTGGHLEQLTRLEKRFEPVFDEIDYATFDDQHSRSLLAARPVHYVVRIPPRGWFHAAQVVSPAWRILRKGNFTDVISTGSAIAVPFLTIARALRIRAHYIESAARSDGPSLSGRLVAKLPGVNLYTQYATWSDRTWLHEGSVFDQFSPTPTLMDKSVADRVVVTLGTMRGYPFRRAVDAVRAVLPEVSRKDVDVLWQVGDTPVEDLAIRAFNMVPSHDMSQAIQEADLVFAHAGIGSCLQILERGRIPVLLPRRSARGEHVDDHQLLIASELEGRQLAVSRDPSHLTAPDAINAMSHRASSVGSQQKFRLVV